jgi:hypothetical protein
MKPLNHEAPTNPPFSWTKAIIPAQKKQDVINRFSAATEAGVGSHPGLFSGVLVVEKKYKNLLFPRRGEWPLHAINLPS